MEYIVIIFLIIMSIIVFKIVFKVRIKEIKRVNENKELEEFTNKFPENRKVTEEILDMMENKEVTIEEEKDTKTSLYIAITNKIIISDMKNNYGRIQTIAHECVHSCQDRTLLLFNFIFANLNNVYFLVISILTLCSVIHNYMLQISILTILFLIEFSVRGFLEVNAMTKSRFVAEKYIDKKNILLNSEKEKLLKEYDKINNVGIPFTLFYLFSKGLIKIFIYTMIAIIINLI